MRLSPAATVRILLGLALILPGCGDQRSATAGTETAAPSGAGKSVAATVRVCRGHLRGLLESMDKLREKLAVGMSYGDYLHEVRAAMAVYDGIRAKRLGLGCLVTVATPAERALNRYMDAANTWGDCLALTSCDSESVEPKLQHEWALASGRLSSAQAGLRGGGPG